MYNFVSLGGTSLSRLRSLNQNIKIVEPTDIDDFKKYIDNGYYAIINGLTNNQMCDWQEYIHYIEQNNIHLFVDALYESNLMKFHLPENLNTKTTLLISNLYAKNHKYFDKVITIPYFLLQSYILWEQLDNKFLNFDDHIKQSKKSFVCLNGVNKPSRRFVYTYLKENNLLDDAVFSFHNRHSSQELINKYPSIKLENDTSDNNDGVTWDNTYNIDWFSKTHFNLVTESTADNDSSRGSPPVQKLDNCFFPTEKTFKPIANSHPFIAISDIHFYKNFKKELGFEIYDEIWNYDFDNTTEKEPRWKEVLDQVKYVSQQGIDYNIIKEKLIHNQQLFFDKQRNQNILDDFLNQIDNVPK